MKACPTIAILVPLLFFTPACSESSSESPAAPNTLVAEDGSSDTTADAAQNADAGPLDVTEADALDTSPAPIDEPMMTLLVGETARGFVDGVGREARFQGITCMTIAPDGSALYVSDTFNGIVRRVDTETGEVKTIGGKALSLSTSDGMGELVRFTEPRGIGITSDGGLLWVADGPTLRSLDLATGEAITWAGLPGSPGFVDGDAVEARLGFLVHDVDVSDDGGTVYLSDRSNDRIRVWDVNGETLSTLVGGGPSGADGTGTEAGLNGNGGVVRDGSTLYIADTFSHTLRSLDLMSGAVETVAGQAGLAGSADGSTATARLDSPQGVALKDGVLYAGGFDGDLRAVDLSAETVITLPVSGLTGTFSPPVAAPDADRLYYADLSSDALLSVDLNTYAVTHIAGPLNPQGDLDGSFAEARFGWIYGLEASSDGELLYVADPGNQAVRVVDLTNGQVTRITHPSWDSPVGLALDEDGGRLFVGDANAGQLWSVSLADESVTPLGTGGLELPWGMALAGEKLFVADHVGVKLLAVDVETGETTVVAGTGVAGSADGPATTASFQGPTGVAWDEATETVFVTDYTGHTVRAIHMADSTVSTVAGNGAEGSADGSPGSLYLPSGVSIRNGKLLVTDTGNHTVRMWEPETGLSTVVGKAGAGASIGPGPGVPVSAATLTEPEALTVGLTGLYISVEYSVMHVPWEALGLGAAP